MKIPVIDLHCDVTYKFDTQGITSFEDARLDVNIQNLRAGGVKVQAFAIFMMPDVPKEQRLQSALNQVRYFHEFIVRPEYGVVHITKWSQIEALQPHEIGAFLTIEGVDFFAGDLEIWHRFHELGILNIGLTWNQANEAADGIAEDLGRGVTKFGHGIIQLNNLHGIFTDVSHLSEQSFWDVIEYARYPIATHSNARAICEHPRNLNDEQLKAMIEKRAPIHLVYHPPFIKPSGTATIADLLKHVEYICALGGKDLIGLGSDFDGITDKVVGLENASKQKNLIEELLKFYTEDDVRGFAYRNFLSNCPI